jgi:hypothetical protein
MALSPLSRLPTIAPPSAGPTLALSLAPTEAAKLLSQVPSFPTSSSPNAPPTLAATVVAARPLPATEGGGQQITLQLPDGTQLQARVATPLSPGSVVVLSLPSAAEGAASLPPPANVPLLVRTSLGTSVVTLPPLTEPLQVPAVTLPLAPPPPPLLVLANLSPAQSLPGWVPTTTPLPGPMLLTLPQTLPATWANQPLILTLQSPTQATLRPAPHASIAPQPALLKITLPVDNYLPMRTEISLVIPNSQEINPPDVIKIAQNQDKNTYSAFILPNRAITSEPSAASPPNPWLGALRLLVPATTPAGVQLGRILPPTPTTPAGLQPVLLASGHMAHLEVLPLPPSLTPPLSPPPGAGNVLRVNIQTLGGPVQILQLQQNPPQLLPPTPGQSTAPTTPPQTPNAVLAPGSVVAGFISSQDALGQPILTLTTPSAMAGQSFTLSLGANAASTPLAATLVVGAKVQVAIGAQGEAHLVALELPAAAARATTLASLGTHWENLTQTLNLLQNINPALAAEARAQLPALANLLPGLVRLLEGIRTKDPAKLLGPTAARLASSLGPDLSGDLQQLQQLLSKNPEDPSQWRGFIIPYLENPEGHPQQGSFFFRRESSDDPRSAAPTRFVAELTLSQLGPIQLDGLVSYPEIWLKLRLLQMPPAGFETGLHSLVATLLEGLNLQGGILTERVKAFPLNPAAELRAAAETAVGIAS